MSLQIKEIIIHTASYYRFQLSETVLSMYVEDLEDLSTTAVLEAYKSYRKNPKNKFFPLPAQIREIIEPVVTYEAEARAIASRICAAVVRYGYNNVIEAKMYIGPVGWSLVQNAGGWNYVSTNFGVNLDPTTFEAQMRNKAVDALQYGSKLGYLDKEEIEYENKQMKIIQAEKEKLIEHLNQNRIASEAAKPDVNAEYIALSSEEREKVIQDFLSKLKKVSNDPA